MSREMVSKEEVEEQLDEMFTPEPDQSGQVQAIKEINDIKNIRMKSEISRGAGESHYFAKLYLLSDLLEWKGLKEYCDHNIILRVSNDRLGRKESVEIARVPSGDNRKEGMMRRLFG